MKRTPLRRHTPLRAKSAMERGKRLRARIDKRWEETRAKLHRRARGACERCLRPAPLHASNGRPAGEGAHKQRRWKGDKYSLRNLWWSCGGPWGCHQKEHREEQHDLCPEKPGTRANERDKGYLGRSGE